VWSGAQRGERGTIPGRSITAGCPKVPTMSPVLFSIQNICFQKTGSNKRAPILLLASGAM